MQSIKKRRFLAALIDLLVIPAIFIVAVTVSLRSELPLYVQVFFNVVWLSIRDMWGGAGPGKRVMHLQVVLQETGEPLSKQTLVHGVLRNLLLMIPFVLVLGYFVEVLMLAVRGERLGDAMAKTTVVDVPQAKY